MKYRPQHCDVMSCNSLGEVVNKFSNKNWKSMEKASSKGYIFISTTLFLFCFLLCSVTMEAQSISRQVISIAGKSSKVSNGTTISWTLGQTAVSHLRSDDGKFSVREGFQQPSIQIGECYLKNEALISLAPNPVKSLLNITVLNPENDNLRFTLTDGQGRILLNRQPLGLWGNELDMSSYAAGMYFVKIHQGKKAPGQVFKVVKVK